MIERIHVQDLKGIESLSFEVGSNLLLISGPNYSGKSSLATAGEFLMCGKPVPPVRNGADSGFVEGELVNGYRIKRTVGRDGKRALTIHKWDADLKRAIPIPSPQSALNDLLGEVPVNITEAGKLDDKKLIRLLLTITGRADDLDALQAQADTHYSIRRQANADVKALRATLSNMTVPDDIPTEAEEAEAEVALKRVQDEIKRIRDSNTARSNLERDIRQARTEAEGLAAAITGLNDDIASLEAQLKTKRSALAEKDKAHAAKLAEVDVMQNKLSDELFRETECMPDLDAAEEQYNAVKRRASFRPQLDQALRLKASIDRETKTANAANEALEECRASILKLFDGVPGVTYDHDNDCLMAENMLGETVRLTDLSGAESILTYARVFAGAGKTPFIRIPNGSELDRNSLKVLGQIASEFPNTFFWVEIVDSNLTGLELIGTAGEEEEEIAE